MVPWQQVLRESHTDPLPADQAAAIRRMAIASGGRGGIAPCRASRANDGYR